MVGNCCPANEFLFQKRTIVPQKNCWLLSYKKYYVLQRIVVSQTNCCPTKTKCCPANKQNDVLQTINCFLTKQIAVLLWITAKQTNCCPANEALSYILHEFCSYWPEVQLWISLYLYCISVSGNIVCILVLTSQDIDLKPSFANILICLVSRDFTA